ncbi:MAG: winged helix-turn-helix domain-containing protein [Promethearchaeota archaeon]|jgi:predicted transcriptional regulator
MSSARRSKFEIWAEVLEFCLRAKRTQTWLLRKTRLKTSAIKETLEFLLSRNLLEQLTDNDITKYHTTDRGEEVLKRFYSLVNDYFELNQSKSKDDN